MGENMIVKVKEYQEKLLEGVKKLVESENFMDFLKFSSKFRSYSFGNILLIWTQRPNATQVAGMKTWNALGRTVKKGEKGIMIFAPFLKKVKRAIGTEESPAPDVTADSLEKTRSQEKEEQTLVGFKSVYVFDVSQTEGKPLPELEVGKPSMDDGDAEELFGKILKASPVPVDFEEIVGSSNGYYMPKERKIVLSNVLTAAQRCKTLLHELAHYLSLDPANAGDFSRSREGLIAEATVRPDVIVIAGDVFDERQPYDSPAFLAADRYMRRLSGIAPVLIVKGTPSHDGQTLKFFETERVYVSEMPEQVFLTPGGFIRANRTVPGDAKALFSCMPSVS